MASSSGLTRLQGDFLVAFFRTTQAFYLTGGGALVGFYRLPRHTDDLDLFTQDANAFQATTGLVEDTCKSIAATCTEAASYPHFRRIQVTRGDEAFRLDLVHELIPPTHDKARQGDVILDSSEEILANKICTLVSRSEVRDLWDVWHLLRRGLSLDDALQAAGRKDAGVDAASLVFVLSQINWDAAGRLAAAGGLDDWPAVARFFRDLCEELALRIAPQ